MKVSPEKTKKMSRDRPKTAEPRRRHWNLLSDKDLQGQRRN